MDCSRTITVIIRSGVSSCEWIWRFDDLSRQGNVPIRIHHFILRCRELYMLLWHREPSVLTVTNADCPEEIEETADVEAVLGLDTWFAIGTGVLRLLLEAEVSCELIFSEQKGITWACAGLQLASAKHNKIISLTSNGMSSGSSVWAVVESSAGGEGGVGRFSVSWTATTWWGDSSEAWLLVVLSIEASYTEGWEIAGVGSGGAWALHIPDTENRWSAGGVDRGLAVEVSVRLGSVIWVFLARLDGIDWGSGVSMGTLISKENVAKRACVEGAWDATGVPVMGVLALTFLTGVWLEDISGESFWSEETTLTTSTLEAVGVIVGSAVFVYPWDAAVEGILGKSSRLTPEAVEVWLEVWGTRLGTVVSMKSSWRSVACTSIGVDSVEAMFASVMDSMGAIAEKVVLRPSCGLKGNIGRASAGGRRGKGGGLCSSASGIGVEVARLCHHKQDFICRLIRSFNACDLAFTHTSQSSTEIETIAVSVIDLNEGSNRITTRCGFAYGLLVCFLFDLDLWLWKSCLTTSSLFLYYVTWHQHTNRRSCRVMRRVVLENLTS